MKTKNYNKLLFCCLLFFTPFVIQAQVEVNQQGDVGIKADPILDFSTLTIENDDNLQNLNSIYEFSGSTAFPTNTIIKSTVNTNQLFRGINCITTNNGTGIAHNINSQINAESSGQVIGINNSISGSQLPYSGSNFYEKIGIVNNVTSANASGENRTGLYNLINGDGDGGRFGVRSSITGSGNGGRTGMNNDVSGTGSGGRRGIQNNVSGFVDGPYSGTNTKYGMLNYVNGVTGTDSDETRIGLYNRVYGNGNGEFRGVSNQVYGDGTGWKFGVLNSIYGAGTGNRTALRNIVSGSGNGLREGVRNEVKGTGSGERVGFRNVVSGPMLDDPSIVKYGIINSVYGESGTDTGEKRVGIENKVNGAGGGPKVGIQTTVEGVVDEERLGIYNDIHGSGNGSRRGLQNVIGGSGSGNRQGISNQVRGSGAAERTGIWNRVFESGSGEYRGIQNIVEGDNGTALKIGIDNRVVAINSNEAVALRSEVVGSGLAGEFIGDVEVNGKVTIQDVINLTAQGSIPTTPATGDIYLDNGTNTGSGTPGLRYYNGTSWVDL